MKVYRILAALGFVLLLCGWWLLATPAGTRWSLSLLPGVLPQLELQGVSGSWIGGVRVSHLRYNAPVVEVTLSDLAVTVRPLFLLAGTLQISSAEAESVVLRLIDPAKPSTRKGLPTVALPLTLAAQRLDVSRFELITRGGRRVEAAIRTALRWRGTWIDANGAVLDAYGYRIETDLAIQLRGEYAVDAQLRLLRPGAEHELDAQLGGSLASLQFEGRYRGLAPLSYRGGARLLDQGLPLWLEATVDADSTLMLGGSSVEARRGELKLDGELNELAGKLSVVLRHEQLGNVELHAPLTWRDSQLGLAGGRVELDRGAIVSDCTMVLKQSQWGCQGKVENISSALLTQAVPELLVTSPLQLSGSWGGQGEVLAFELPAISGSLGGQGLSGALSLSSADWQRWQVHRARLVAGSNRLVISGAIDDAFDLRVAIVGDNLGQLSETVKGAFNGRLALAGPLAAPEVSGRFQGSALQVGELAIPRLRGHLDLQELGKGQAEVRLRATELSYGQQQIGNLKLTLDGSATRPQLRAALDGGDHLLSLDCRGLEGAHWELRCEQLEGLLFLQGKPRRFAIERPLEFEWREASGELRVKPNCVRMEPASLCLNQRAQYRSGNVAGVELSLRRLPLAWWYGLLPPSIKGKPGSYLEADLKLASLAPWQALLSARIDKVEWVWRGQGGEFPASLEGIVMRLALDEQRALFTGEARSPVLGGLKASLAVDDPGGEQSLDGRIVIDDLQLRTFSWLSATIQQLKGVLNGDIRITGTAAVPRLQGALDLRGGELRDVSLPYPLQRVRGRIELRQDWADIKGRFRLNDGDGKIEGRLHWQEQAPKWRLDATVVSDAITLPVLDNSVAQMAARIKLGMRPGIIDIGGKVKVDRADIRLATLPPDTISVSPDAEIIGGDERSPWRLNADLVVDLGNQVRFRGFGVDMTLAGALRWRNTQRLQNHLTGEVKVTRGRFRAYGQDLNIRNGRLIFAGLAGNPDLKLEAVRHTRDRHTVGGLRVTGTLQEPVGELFSEPSMTDSDVAYLMLTGRLPPEPGQKDASSGGALLNLGLARTNEAAAKLASRMGIEGFQISTADGEKGIETHVSGFLSDDLFVSYGTGFEEQTASLTLQYYITPHIVIEAVGGFTSALDLVYSFRID